MSSRFPVPAERCSRKRVCHKLFLPGAVAGELSKPKTPSPQKRRDHVLFKEFQVVLHGRPGGLPGGPG